MDDTHLQAQQRGYDDGRNNRHQTDHKKSYMNYSSLINAYNRGYKIGYYHYKELFAKSNTESN